MLEVETRVRCAVLDSVELAPEVCRQLLDAGVMGRVALCTPDGPHIVPVNYSVVADSMVFQTTPYSVLGTSGRNSLVAFETDHVDYGSRHAWSVVVRGRCRWVDEPDAVAAIEATWPPRPWAAGSRRLYLRLPLDEVSGRKLGLDWDPLEGLVVRRDADSDRS
jgi:nitroimidazol reductase NimA-like FMN-containing flavoprotein (pyridoxamine 5'-phosphate oxidase superfamily)